MCMLAQHASVNKRKLSKCLENHFLQRLAPFGAILGHLGSIWAIGRCRAANSAATGHTAAQRRVHGLLPSCCPSAHAPARRVPPPSLPAVAAVTARARCRAQRAAAMCSLAPGGRPEGPRCDSSAAAAASDPLESALTRAVLRLRAPHRWRARQKAHRRATAACSWAPRRATRCAACCSCYP